MTQTHVSQDHLHYALSTQGWFSDTDTAVTPREIMPNSAASSPLQLTETKLQGQSRFWGY